MQAAQQIIDGLASGAIYAALALALVLVHRATGVINFAQGELGVLSAYGAWTLSALGAPVWLAVLGAVAASVPLGAMVERLVMRRFHGESALVRVVVTVGVLIFVNGLTGMIWGTDTKQFPAVFPAAILRVGGVAAAASAVGNLLVLLAVVVLLEILFLKTRFGLALRAVADNPESSALLGLPVHRLLMAGWGLAAALGALAACLIAPKVYLDPNMMATVLVYALAAAIVGGLNSPLGAIVAGLGIGVVENLAGVYVEFIGNDLRIAVPLALMAIVLLVRPQGLFGQRETERV